MDAYLFMASRAGLYVTNTLRVRGPRLYKFRDQHRTRKHTACKALEVHLFLKIWQAKIIVFQSELLPFSADIAYLCVAMDTNLFQVTMLLILANVDHSGSDFVLVSITWSSLMLAQINQLSGLYISLPLNHTPLKAGPKLLSALHLEKLTPSMLLFLLSVTT